MKYPSSRYLGPPTRIDGRRTPRSASSNHRHYAQPCEPPNSQQSQARDFAFAAPHYGLRASAKIPAVLTNTGFVNEKWQNSTPHTESTPLNLSLKYATDDYVGDPYGYAEFGANPSTGSSISQQNYIGLCPFSVTQSPRLTGQTDDGLSHLMARFKR